MPIWQLCANLLIPNRLCYNLSCSLSDASELYVIIDKAKSSYVNISFVSSDLLKDLLTSVPLFCKDGNYYKWAHKSLQEYFAALFISIDSKNSQEKILKAIYNSDNIQRYTNLLDLYFDIDPNGFQRYILIPLLEEFISYYARLSITKPSIPEKMIDVRLGLLFGHTILIGNQSTDASLFSDNFGEAFKEKFGLNIKCITFFDPIHYVADSFHKQAYIIDLLKYKVPELFSPYRTSKRDFMIKGTLLVNGVETMSDSAKDFESLNVYLSNASRDGYLDINLVKPYLENLKTTIASGFDSDDLCDGL